MLGGEIMFKGVGGKGFLFGLISYFVVTTTLSLLNRNTAVLRTLSFVIILIVAYFIIPLYKKHR